MDFLGNILSGQDLVNKDYVDKVIPVVPTKLSELTNDLGLGSLAYKSSLVASDIPALDWSKITSGKPTTLAGYGITDAYTASSIDTKLADYLPLSGGTIKGVVVLNGNGATNVPLNIATPSMGNTGYIRFGAGISANELGHLGFSAKGEPAMVYEGTVHPLIHSGNVGGYKAGEARMLTTTYAENINYSAYATHLKLIRYDGNWESNGFPNNWTSGLSVMAGYVGWQLVVYGGNADTPYFRKVSDAGTWSGWRALAFTDSDITGNAATANKLITSSGADAIVPTTSGYSLVYGDLWVWAQDASERYVRLRNSLSDLYTRLKTDGSGEIFVSGNHALKLGTANTTRMLINSSGNVTIGGSDLAGTSAKLYVDGVIRTSGAATIGGNLQISPASKIYLTLTANSSYGYIQALHDGVVYLPITINPRGGNVGIGTTSPAYKLDVNGDTHISGNLIVTGDSSSGSDIRFKDVIESKRIKIDDIANAPLFTFKWNDRQDDSIHLGTSAQYWETVAPWLVKGEDFKTLDYATLGVAIGISLANKTLSHDDEIKILKNKVKALEAEINRLRRHDN